MYLLFILFNFNIEFHINLNNSDEFDYGRDNLEKIEVIIILVIISVFFAIFYIASYMFSSFIHICV